MSFPTNYEPFTLLETPTVGLEDLQRTAFYIFVGGMNNAIDQIAEYWRPRDELLDEKMGSHYAPTKLEYIPCENFHEGHKPSLVNGVPENYPNLAVFAMSASPAGESAAFDELEAWMDTLLVEVMVKGLEEVETNRRIQRTVEAVVLCLRRNLNFGGAIYGVPDAPDVVISELFAVRNISQGGAYPGEARSGGRYVWQGAQVTFRIQKDAVRPPVGRDTFAGSSQVDYSNFIDQG
jgi:hypothetical protein